MPVLVDLLGEELEKNDGSTVTVSSWCKEGKVIGLYFSAHWCPPCRKFTPVLAEWYKKFKDSDRKDDMEMVFISSDRDDSSFKEYFNDQPWHALPFAKRDEKAKLSAKYKVQGIPTLIFLEANTAKFITNKGREKIAANEPIEEFPWYPKPLSVTLSGKVLKHTENDGVEELDVMEAIKNKTVGIYFSAHWCPPCRGFTPDLVKTYKKIKEDGKEFEIIFVSSDRDESAFKEYWGSMPWVTIPFGDKRKEVLSEYFEISGIPDLQILDENLSVITGEGRGEVAADPEGKEFPWIPKPLNPLMGHTATKINSSACLVYLTGDDEEEQKKAPELLKDAAESYAEAIKSGSDIPELGFLYEVKDNEDMVDSLRQFLKLGDKAPLLLVVNIPEQKKYVHAGDITKENIQQIADQFKAENLEFSSLR